METLLHIVAAYGVWVAFVFVLLDQGGLPLPSYPVVVVAAAVAFNSQQPVLPIMAGAIVAVTLADLLWYAGGRRFGTALLKLICKVSLSADSCVGSTRRFYGRWGPPSLIFGKYIPGVAAVATTLAGETGTSLKRFALYDGLGAVLWAGGAVALGVIFHRAVGAVLTQIERLGQYALLVLVIVVALFIAIKWWQRHRFLVQIRMSRISTDELARLLDARIAVTILDVRSPERRARTGWIPGSIHVEDVERLGLDPCAEVVIYCECPNDASAAMAAKKLQQKGFTRVRPLGGGFDAWRERGLPLDRESGRFSARDAGWAGGRTA